MGGGNLEWQVRENQNGSSLTHYGVLGMKWGVRKDKETSSKRNTPTLTTAALIKNPLDAFKDLIGYDKTFSTGTTETTIHVNGKADYGNLKKTAEYYDGKTKAKYASEEEAQRKLDSFTRANMHLSEEQQRIATNHNASSSERKKNCFECTMAYEMRQRGYVVQANKVQGGFGFEVLHAFDVKDSFTVKSSRASGTHASNEDIAKECYDRIAEMCQSYGEGARGMLGIKYADYDSGHAMSWVVENGVFKIIDSQSDAVAGYQTFLKCDGNVDVYRLDNAKVLPGVTDFVEAFEPTEVEFEYNKKRKEEQLAKWKKEHPDVGKKSVDKVIKDIGKNIADFVSKGIEIIGNFLKNPLNIQDKK